MKKILLISAVNCFMLSVATANFNFNIKDESSKNFYIKLEGGISDFGKSNEELIKAKSKSKGALHAGIGFGTYINNKTRVDILISHFFNPEFKHSSSVSMKQTNSNTISQYYYRGALSIFRSQVAPQIALLAEPYRSFASQIFSSSGANLDQVTTSISQYIYNQAIQQATAAAGGVLTPAVTTAITNTYNAVLAGLNDSTRKVITADISTIKLNTNTRRQSKVESAMISGYYDLVDTYDFKVFAGAGVGISLLQEKLSVSSNLSVNNQVIASDNKSYKSKVAKNFAYSLILGTSVKVAESIDIDLSYNFKDFGKTKSAKYQNIEIGKTAYKGHFVNAGIRYSF